MISIIHWTRRLLLRQIYFLNFLLWKILFRNTKASSDDFQYSFSYSEICILLHLRLRSWIVILSVACLCSLLVSLLIFTFITFIPKEIDKQSSLVERRGKTDDESNYLRFLPSAWLHIPDKRFESSLGIPLLSMRFYFLILLLCHYIEMVLNVPIAEQCRILIMMMVIDIRKMKPMSSNALSVKRILPTLHLSPTVTMLRKLIVSMDESMISKLIDHGLKSFLEWLVVIVVILEDVLMKK